MDIPLANIDHHNLIEVANIEGYIEANDIVINEGDEGKEDHNDVLVNEEVINVPSNQIINWNDRNTRLKVWSMIYFVIFISDMISVSNQHSPSSSDNDTLTNVILLLTADICLAFSIIFVIEINRYICYIVGITQIIGAALYITLAVLTTTQLCATTITEDDHYYGYSSIEISNPHIHQCRLYNIAPKLCVALFSIYYAWDILFITAFDTTNMRIKCTSFILAVFGSLRAVNVLLDIQLSTWSIARLYGSYTIGIGYAVLAAVCLLLFIYTNYHKQFTISLGCAQIHCLLLLLPIASIFTWSWYKTSDDDGNGNSLPMRGMNVFMPAALFLVFDVYCGSRQDENANEINWNISSHRLTIWSIIYFVISIADITIFITLDLARKEFIRSVSDIDSDSVDDAYTYFTLSIIQNGIIISVTFYILLANSKHYCANFAAVLFATGNVLKIAAGIVGMTVWCTDSEEQDTDSIYYDSDYDSDTSQDSFSSDECRMPFIGTILFSSLFGIYLAYDIIYKTGNNNLVRIGCLSLTLCVFAFVNGINTAYYDNNGVGHSQLSQLYNIMTAGYLLMGTGCILITIYVGCKMKYIQLISSGNKNLFHKFVGLLLLVSAAMVYTLPWISNVSSFSRAPSVFLVSVHSVIMCVPAVLILVYDIQYV